MKLFIVLAAVLLASNAHVLNKRAAEQNPKIWDALKVLRGGKDLTTQEIQDLLNAAVAGQDYPANAVIPDKVVDCKAYNQPGFYADDSDPSKCQVFHRCDENGVSSSYLCPNMTLFNQITLICDWFVNVDCAVSKQFVDYSNSRLGDPTAVLLDNQMEIAVLEGTGAVASVSAKGKAPAKPAAAKMVVTAPKGAAAAGKKGAAATTVAPATTAAAGAEEPSEGAAAEETSAAPSTTKAAAGKAAAAPKMAAPAAKGAKGAAVTTVAPSTTSAAGAEESSEAAAGEETSAAPATTKAAAGTTKKGAAATTVKAGAKAAAGGATTKKGAATTTAASTTTSAAVAEEETTAAAEETTVASE
jgi:hypothetical protein